VVKLSHVQVRLAGFVGDRSAFQRYESLGSAEEIGAAASTISLAPAEAPFGAFTVR
jgi:hypothetical protein